MIIFRFAITLLALFLPSRGNNDDWFKFRHDLQNTGQTSYVAAQTNQILWSQGIGTVAHSSPSVVDRLLYIGSDRGLFAIKIEDGSILWKSPIPISFSSPLVIPQSHYPGCTMIVVGGLNGYLYAFNENGSQLWKAHVMAYGSVSASPTVYVSDQDSNYMTLYLVGNRISNDNKEQTETGLWSIDGQTGSVRWFFKVCVDWSVNYPGYNADDNVLATTVVIDPTCAVGNLFHKILCILPFHP